METTLTVSDPSHVGEARRTIALLGHTHDLSEELVAQSSLVASELCTNILKYARSGSLVVGLHRVADAVVGLDLIGLDKGPGIVNIGAAAADGYSTGGSLGFGLGTVRRASAVFDAFSAVGLGTAIFSRVLDGRSGKAEVAPYLIGSRSVPIRGERVCGDGWSVQPNGPGLAVTVVDGLGHGPKAALAAQAALAVFNTAVATQGPSRTIQLAHRALTSTRGAVMAVAVIDPVAGVLHFSGMGNIGAVLLTPTGTMRLASNDGTVGFGGRTARETSHPWLPQATLVMSSDGLSTKWTLAGYPGLLDRHPMLIAAVLHRDFTRDSDDATVVVVRGR